jgi:hypothetical protein
VWRGLEGAITGWIMAGLISMPIAWIVLALATVIETLLPRLGIDTDGLMISLSPAITCGAMWLAGRWMVRSIAAASWRRAHLVRRQVAAIGFAVMGVAVLMLPADFTWLGVILSIGIPFAFAAGAMSAGGRDDGRPWVAVRWPSRFPSRRKVLWGSVIGLVVAIAFGAVAGVMGMNDSWTDGEASAPPQDPWTVGGYAAVAPARAEQDLGLVGSAMPREGWVMVNLPTDAVDWDRWTGLRVEAWRATSPYSGSGVQALVDPERGPYLVVPMADPWSQPKVAVRVGQPGIGGFVLFVVAQDPATGARVVIGSPEGEQTTFHGSLIDWFAAL